jgi:hypothetical protein
MYTATCYTIIQQKGQILQLELTAFWCTLNQWRFMLTLLSFLIIRLYKFR